MDKKKFYSIIYLVFAIALTIPLATGGKIYAQECRIIKVHSFDSPAGKFRIDPETLVIKKGDCVVWINFVGVHSIKVHFDDAKKCEDVTDAPTGFKITADNCYVTDLITIGGTSSLRFMVPGTYEYKIEAPGRERMKGKIVVE